MLRRVTREGAARLAALDTAVLDTPDWLMARWTETYGAATAHAIAAANGHEPALDLTVKSDPEYWAAKLNGRVLPTGTVRTIAHGAVTALPGFAEGAWWVQDAAAALPARLFGEVRGRRVADLCAAPGGKTAQLAAAGAIVTAVDRAPARLDRLARKSRPAVAASRSGLRRCRRMDGGAKIRRRAARCAVLRDRHHPPPSRRAVAQERSRHRQARRRATPLARPRRGADGMPGGTLIYCTCSLEPEENENVVADLLARDERVRRAPIAAAEIFGRDEFISTDGDLRTLPCQLADADSQLSGLDGFYAARLVKS